LGFGGRLAINETIGAMGVELHLYKF
jgi:hypothetical protein